MPPKKRSTKRKKGKLDGDGLPSFVRAPSTKELILAHQIATAEKETHDVLVETRIFEEKIILLERQIAEAKAEQETLIKRMKRQADAYRRFLKYGAKGKWKEGEVVNLGEGLRVTAKKPHVTKEDVADAKQRAEETRRILKEGVVELEEMERTVDAKLQKRNGIIGDRKRYRDEGAASDAGAIAGLEAKLMSEGGNFEEMARVAQKVIEQSKQEVKDRAESEKKRAVDNAALEMSRKREKGVHRFVERDNDWLRRTLAAYRSTSSFLEAQVSTMEAENLQLVDALLSKIPESSFPGRHSVPDWRQSVDDGGHSTAEERADAGMTLVPSRHRSTVGGSMKKLPSYPVPFGETETELLLSRTPTLRSIAFPLYRERLSQMAALENETGEQLFHKPTKVWKNRIATPEGVPKELDWVVSADASRPVSTSACLSHLSKRDAYLERIADHLFAIGVNAKMEEEEEERKEIESNLRVFGAKVKINELILRPLREDDQRSYSTSMSVPSDDQAADLSLPRVSFGSPLGTKAAFVGLNYPLALLNGFPAPQDVEKTDGNLSRWPIDASILKKVLRLPFLDHSHVEDSC